MKNNKIKYNIEIDDYPINLDPFVSNDFNFKIISKLLYYSLGDKLCSKINKKNDILFEIKLSKFLEKNKIYAKYFVNGIKKHILNRTHYYPYFSFIDLENLNVISHNKFIIKLKFPFKYFEKFIRSNIIVAIDDFGNTIKKREFLYTNNGFKIIDKNIELNFIVNKRNNSIKKFLKNNYIDLTAFSHPNYNILKKEFRSNYELKNKKGSLIYYLKFNNTLFKNEFINIRNKIHNELKKNIFLKPTYNFMGNDFRDLELNRKFSKLKTNKIITIGYSNYSPNQYIAFALKKILNEEYFIKSKLVKYENLKELIENFKKNDINLAITYPNFNCFISLGLKVIFDISKEKQRDFFLNLKNNDLKSMSKIISSTNTMLPIFISEYYYLQKKNNLLNINKFGEIYLDENK